MPQSDSIYESLTFDRWRPRWALAVLALHAAALPKIVTNMIGTKWTLMWFLLILERLLTSFPQVMPYRGLLALQLNEPGSVQVDMDSKPAPVWNPDIPRISSKMIELLFLTMYIHDNINTNSLWNLTIWAPCMGRGISHPVNRRKLVSNQRSQEKWDPRRSADRRCGDRRMLWPHTQQGYRGRKLLPCGWLGACQMEESFQDGSKLVPWILFLGETNRSHSNQNVACHFLGKEKNHSIVGLWSQCSIGFWTQHWAHQMR